MPTWKDATNAIDAFFVDRSRNIHDTVAGLEEIRDHVELRLDVLRDDIEKGNETE